MIHYPVAASLAGLSSNVSRGRTPPRATSSVTPEEEDQWYRHVQPSSLTRPGYMTQPSLLPFESLKLRFPSVDLISQASFRRYFPVQPHPHISYGVRRTREIALFGIQPKKVTRRRDQRFICSSRSCSTGRTLTPPPVSGELGGQDDQVSSAGCRLVTAYGQGQSSTGESRLQLAFRNHELLFPPVIR